DRHGAARLQGCKAEVVEGGDFQEIIAREVDKLKESLLASFAEKFPARSCRPARAVCLVGLEAGGGWCRTVNAFKTAGGFCCAARDASRGGTLALPAPKPGSSWKPIAAEPTEMETSEVNNLAAERESTFVSSVGEADSKEQGLRDAKGGATGDRYREIHPNDSYRILQGEYRAVCRWSEMTRAVMDGFSRQTKAAALEKESFEASDVCDQVRFADATPRYSMPDEYFSIHPNWTREVFAARRKHFQDFRGDVEHGIEHPDRRRKHLQDFRGDVAHGLDHPDGRCKHLQDFRGDVAHGLDHPDRRVVAPKMVTTHQGMRVKSQMLDESSRLQKYVSHPDHLVRMMWLCTGTMARQADAGRGGMLLIFWDLITIPLVLADATEDTQNFLVLVSHCTVWYWIVDLFYNFFTGYDTGVLIEVVIKLLEIIAATELSSVKVLRAVRILRFLRLLRLQKISRIIEVIAKHFTSLTFWLTVNHYLAIFFMAIGSRGVKNGGPNWLDTYTDEAISLHWSLTQFTPSTNNVGPISVPERLFAIAVVLVALALFSSFLSSITNAVNALRSVRLSSASQEAQIRQFFHERNLPAALLAQVKARRRAITTAFMRVRVAAISRMREKDVKLLLELPEALKRRLHTEMYLVHVMELPWWPDFVEKVCHRATTEMLGSPGGDIFVASEGAIVPVDHGHSFEIAAGKEVSLRPYQPLADVGLWAVWKYRGHLSAEATCRSEESSDALNHRNVPHRGPYLFISAEEFSEVAINFGGTNIAPLRHDANTVTAIG
ncbi:unnamed protein product, partial [Cladocopium goreaui]